MAGMWRLGRYWLKARLGKMLERLKLNKEATLVAWTCDTNNAGLFFKTSLSNEMSCFDGRV
jgi:hypothetical protein